MSNQPNSDPARVHEKFRRTVASKAARKVKARKHRGSGVWFGLGMMGLVGWSIVVPTLLGAALGNWMDKHHSGNHSWTLMLLLGGLVLGCWNALRWVFQEDESISKVNENNGE